jgi:hypothetical protein
MGFSVDFDIVSIEMSLVVSSIHGHNQHLFAIVSTLLIDLRKSKPSLPGMIGAVISH